MPKKAKNKIKNSKPIAKIRKKKPKLVKPREFMKIMKRLKLIDQEIKKEEELFDIKIKSLELEKQYLREILQPKNASIKIGIYKKDNLKKKKR